MASRPKSGSFPNPRPRGVRTRPRARASEPEDLPTTPATPPSRARWAVVGVLVVLSVLLGYGVLISSGAVPDAFGAGSSPSPPVVQRQEVLAAGLAGTLGPDLSSAIVVPFSIPAGGTHAFVAGSLTAVQCTPGTGNCTPNIAVFTSNGWQLYRSGGPLRPVWCVNASGRGCPAQSPVAPCCGGDARPVFPLFDSRSMSFVQGVDGEWVYQVLTSDLAPVAGESLELCVWAANGTSLLAVTVTATSYWNAAA